MDLTPRVYRNGSKNTAQPKNVVDTLNFEVIDNALPEESQVIASKEITSGHIYGTSAVVTLPVDSSQPSRHFHFTSASRHTAGADYTFAKGRAEVLLMYDTTTFSLDRPVDEIPVVSFELSGTSKVKPRGAGSFTNYPTFENMLDPNYNLVNWFNTASGVQNQDKLQQTVNKGGKGAPFNTPAVGDKHQRNHAADGQPPAKGPQAVHLQDGKGKNGADGDHQGAFDQTACSLCFHVVFLQKNKIVPDGRSGKRAAGAQRLPKE